MIESGQQNVGEYVQKLRLQNNGISDGDSAKKIVRRKSVKNGLVGAVTGIGGLPTLPLTIPADVVSSWKIQIFLALAIAEVYGNNKDNSDLKTDVYLILAGDTAKETLKRLGIEISKGITRKAINKYINREIMKKIWKIIPQKIITKAGEKSFTSFMKMVPGIGAPVGFCFDWAAAKAIGKTAIRYYSGGG